jgi:putative transposase
MDDHYRTPLISLAIRRAAAVSDLAKDAIFHTDRGTNYTSQEFHNTLTQLGVRHSVGRTGICYDNAMAESFFAALKNELVHRTVYPTRAMRSATLRDSLMDATIQGGLHSGLSYQTPN